MEGRILNTVEDNPSTNSRAVGHELDVSHAVILRILYDDGMHSYHLHRMQAMIPDDYLPRFFDVHIVSTHSRLQLIKPSQR